MFATLLLAACGEAPVTLQLDSPRPAMTLQELASECEATIDASGTGLVDVAGDLRDANVNVDIPVPCLVRLGADTDIVLDNVELTAQELQLDDLDADAGRNRIRIQRSDISAASLLVALSDAEDHFQVEASTIEGRRGILVEVAGTRNDENTGGSLRLVNSELLAPEAEEAGVGLSASEHDGHFRAVNLIIDPPASAVIVAGDCRIHRSGAGRPVDCGTETVVEELRRQAEDLLDE